MHVYILILSFFYWAGLARGQILESIHKAATS